MPRSLRIEYPGVVYHVLNRGNYKKPIFYQEKAKQSFEEKNKRDIQRDKKSADWKVLVALFMKDHTSVPNNWLTKHLNMGVPHGVSRYTTKLASNKGRKHKQYIEIAKITE